MKQPETTINSNQLHPVASCTTIPIGNEEIHVLTPGEDGFDSESFVKWYQGTGMSEPEMSSGKYYLSLNAFEEHGQKELARLNQINCSDDFWKDPLHVTYEKLLVLVHEQGPYCGWTFTAVEGLQRTTAQTIKNLCSPLDLKTGITYIRKHLAET